MKFLRSILGLPPDPMEQRLTAASTADAEALRVAIAVLRETGKAVFTEKYKRYGDTGEKDPIWTKLFNARFYLECQLSDAVELSLGDWPPRKRWSK